jgi:hypothetical protein
MTRDRLAALPRLARLVAEIEQALGADVERGLSACEAPFAALVHDGVVGDVINYELERVLAAATRLDRSRATRSLRIHDGERCAIELALLEPGATTQRLWGLCEHRLLTVAGGDDVTLAVERFTQPPCSDDGQIDRGQPLMRLPQLDLRPGQVLALRAGRDLYRLHPTAACVEVLLTTRLLRPLRWEFSPETLCALSATSVDDSASRLVWAAHLAVQLGSASSLPALRALATHPLHFVRWAAIGSVLLLDRDAGAELVARARDDLHPDVRAAAARVHAQLAAGPGA